MRKIKISLLLIFTLGAIVSGALWERRASADNSSQIIYHDGPIMTGSSDVFVIWYGNWAALTGPNSKETQDILTRFLIEIGGTPRFASNTYYPDFTGSYPRSLLFAGDKPAVSPHGVELDAAALQAIVTDSLMTNSLPVDPAGIYIVVGSSDISSNATGFCTPNSSPHHGSFNFGNKVLKYAFVGNAARCPTVAGPQFFDSNGNQLPSPNGNFAADVMVSTMTRALDGTVTDPLRTGWFDGLGRENHEKCNGIFGRTYTTANGARANHKYGSFDYLIQDTWQNIGAGFCAPFNDAAPTADNQQVQVHRDTPKLITLTGDDPNGDLLNFIIVTPPQDGTLAPVPGNSALTVYTPAAGFYGADSFIFKTSDGILESSIATVSITVDTNLAFDGFDPNANGLVRTAVVQPDGKILIGGDFTSLFPNAQSSVTRNYIARLNPNGTVDPTFNPSANSSVQAIALQSDGKILVGGDFSTLTPNGGASINRNCLARLNADGTVDTTFDPRASGSVLAIAVQADGDILIGGDFATLAPGGGATVARNRIARLHANGSVDTIFDPKASTTVNALAQQSDGKILIGGKFTTLAPNGGPTVARKYLARLNIDGTLDAPFDPGANDILSAITVQPDGKILIGGAFTSLGPGGGALITRNNIARLNTNGTIDTTFDPNAGGFVRAIALQADGKILIGGGFNTLAPNGGGAVTHKYIARLNAYGTVEAAFNPAPSDQVFTIASQPDGKIILGGAFFAGNSILGQKRNRIARLEVDGRLDQNLNLNAEGSAVSATAVQPDGKILIGGNFTSVLGVARQNIARLNPDGTVDPLFNPGANDYVNAIAIQPDGKILVGGFFTAFAPNGGASVTRNRIARLNRDGTLDTTFDPNANDLINTIALQPDGKILMGGFFTALQPNGGASVSRFAIARLNTNGAVDTAFNVGANDYVYAIAQQADGKVLVGGSFTSIGPNGGTAVLRNHIARLNTDGAVDPAFDPNANSRVAALAVQPDGKILVGGFFSALAPFGGASVPRSCLARLNMDGTVDNAFNPNPDNLVGTLALQADGKILIGGSFNSLSPNGGASQAHKAFARLNADGTLDTLDPQPDNWVFGIALLPDGKILVGGSFDNIGGQPRSLFARLANDTAAIQNLSVAQTSVIWTRSAAEPQLWRVTFEQSTDGVNYTFLGNGTRVGTTSDFTLAGQNLPVQQNLYIRARGFYRSGNLDASESITESVRNAFLQPMLHLAFGQQPTITAEGGIITPAVTVQILDASNNLVNSTAAVTIDIGTNPSSGILTGARTVSAVAGTATFNTLGIDKPGSGYTLAATGTNLTGALSNPFSITVEGPSSIAATAGSGQSTTINSTFGTALQATVTTSSGKPVSGVIVTFTAPPGGPSGTFANNTTTTTATTAANGTATSSLFKANGAAGLYAISASINAGSLATTFSLINLKANQTINVATHAPAAAVFNTQFNVGAASSSGLPVTYSSSGSCTNNGATFTMTSGAGACTVKYEQAGDVNHNAAPTVTETVTAQKAAQAITFGALADKVFGDSDFAVNASASSGLSPSFLASGQCTVNGSTVHLTGAGSCSVTASQPGSANYNAATDVTRAFTITKAGQTISFDSLANKTFGDSDFAISANTNSGLALSFAAAGQCTVSGALVHLTGAGSCALTASQLGDSNYNAATEVQRSFQIAKARQTITFDAIANKTFGDPDFQISASATSGRPVTFTTSGQCTNSGPDIHVTGAGSCTVTASEAGDANYNAATEAPRSFQIAKAGQTITFDAIANKTFGEPDFQISASTTSGRPVTFATSGQCSNSGPGVHITGAGSCTVTASESGDANYSAAPDVVRSFQISKASTTTALSSSANPSTVGQSVTFAAAVTSGVGVPGGTVTFKYDGAAITSCSDVTLQSGSASCVTSELAAGTHTVTAEYSGAANFEPSAGSLITEKPAGSVFEFSQASYVVAERGGFVTITVQRTGDLTSPAPVDYTTDDGSLSSVAVACGLVTGTALERCDYTRAAGTLQFAANETEKTFVVLINDDSYVEGTETSSITLSNPGGGAALGPRATATLQIMDDLAESLGNPSDDQATFVRQHYHDLLNREPDSEGLQFWTNNLECDTEACAERKRIDTSASFFLSIEFQETGYLVERFYKVAYGDAMGVSTFGGPHQLSVPIIRWREFLHDTQEIGNRVIVGQATWQQQLEDQKQAFAREFISRARFTLRYPASLTAEQFVNQLNANTGGVLTNAELRQLEELFGGPGAASAEAAKRAQVLRTIAESQALQQNEFNRAFVLMQYFGYLRRNPDDAQDTDYTGYDFWLQKLERFGGNYVNAEMVKAFVSSIEYRQRFGQ